jgi:tetratricopeptide (TPR) repeat protein
LIALFYAEEDWRGKHDWEKFKREWEAKGERFDRASVVPPPVPDDQNFALTPVVASCYLHLLDKSGHRIFPENTNVNNQLAMDVSLNSAKPTNGIGNWQKFTPSDLAAWQHYYRTLATTTNRFPVAPQPQSPAADVLLALDKYDPTIEALRQAGRLADSRFPLEYDTDDPIAMVLPHLLNLRRCAQVLQVRALAELQNGQSDQALDDVKLMLRLANSIRAEPIMVSQLVRAAIVNQALQPVWEGLLDYRWSDAQLSELDQALSGLDFLGGYRLSMRGELALCQSGVFDGLRHHPERYASLFSDNYNPYPAGGWMRLCVRLLPSGWLYQNQLRCARPMVEFYLPAVDASQQTVSPSKIESADQAVAAQVRRPNAFNLGVRLLFPALGPAALRFAHAQSAVDLAYVAIALERYRLAHGEYPDSLDALVPQFIAKVPHDVINGQLLHYRREAGGRFVLYSVGWNETDDGGAVALTKSGSVGTRNGDWVWRYPQK